MTNPLIQAIDERISGLENLMAHKWADKGLLEWRINELKEARKLAIAEETRIVKAFIDSCMGTSRLTSQSPKLSTTTSE